MIVVQGSDATRVDPVLSPDELIESFRSRGMRATPQRRAVFLALHENRSHPTAEAVWNTVVADMPTVSLRTVYSVLGELVTAREINQVDLGTGAHRFDPNTSAHHHVVCGVCGSVTDVDVDHSPIGPHSSPAGFRTTDTEIVFRGICQTCDS